MTNLVNEFFNRNLTEAEAQSLEELLGNSPEEAIRFGEKMKQEYLAMGLPIPTIPKDFGLSHQVLSLTKLALLATTLSPVILVWSLWPKTTSWRYRKLQLRRANGESCGSRRPFQAKNNIAASAPIRFPNV